MTAAQRQARHRAKRHAELEALQAELQQLRAELANRPPADAGREELQTLQQECTTLRAKVATGREAVALLLLAMQSPAMRNQAQIRLREKGFADWL